MPSKNTTRSQKKNHSIIPVDEDEVGVLQVINTPFFNNYSGIVLLQ
jgi:hypothetical protein